MMNDPAIEMMCEMEHQRGVAEERANANVLMEVLHKIATAYAARRHLAGSELSESLRAKMKEAALTDEQIENLAIETWTHETTRRKVEVTR